MSPSSTAPHQTPCAEARVIALGVVVIGRNEGARLIRCLESVRLESALVVYVDSGSQDGSPNEACALGVEVVELDMSRPFTAARARNAGLQRLIACRPDVMWVQFVDGDCEMRAGWLGLASGFLGERDDVAVVCGRLRERHPEATIYNQLCDLEWQAPAGESAYCGGIAMVRVAAIQAIRGFREDLIAGEEPELCVRLRAAGWRIWRLDDEMAWHDAAITRFGQWWTRTIRGGFAFAQGAHLHGAGPFRHWVREARRAWAWGLALPSAIALACLVYSPWAMLGGLLYPILAIRTAWRLQGPWRLRGLRGAFLALGKPAEGWGWLRFHWQRYFGGREQLIEYK